MTGTSVGRGTKLPSPGARRWFGAAQWRPLPAWPPSTPGWRRRRPFPRRAPQRTPTAGSARVAEQEQADPPFLSGPVIPPADRFRGQVLLITGATSGIGRRAAERFAAEGASVFFCGRREELGAEVEAGIRQAGGEATYLRCDVREPEQVQAFVQACVETYGRLDIAFNNAGIFMTPGELHEIAVDNYLDIMLTNAGGEFFAMKYEIPVMRAQGGGVIVNMASVAGFKGFPNTAAYNASKHGIVGMTKAAAIANAPHNIRVNAIAPLAVDTPQLRESFAYSGSPTSRRRRRSSPRG